MAANNNLTDFLTGLADKIRSLLGTTALIDPQEMTDKIQAVYDKGLANGGPAASTITAAAGDVLEGRVFGTGGPNTATGTLPEYSGTYQYDPEVIEGTYLAYKIPRGGYTASGGAYIRATKAAVASAIGLTAAKLVKGNTVLGISGSTTPRVAAHYSFTGGQVSSDDNTCKVPNAAKTNGGTVVSTRWVTLPAGTYSVTGTVWYALAGTGGGTVQVCKLGAPATALCSATVETHTAGTAQITQGSFYGVTLTLSASTTVGVSIKQTAGTAYGTYGNVCITRVS